MVIFWLKLWDLVLLLQIKTCICDLDNFMLHYIDVAVTSVAQISSGAPVDLSYALR